MDLALVGCYLGSRVRVFCIWWNLLTLFWYRSSAITVLLAGRSAGRLMPSSSYSPPSCSGSGVDLGEKKPALDALSTM